MLRRKLMHIKHTFLYKVDGGLNAKHSQQMNEEKTVINDRTDLVLEEKHDENYQPSEKGMSRFHYLILS